MVVHVFGHPTMSHHQSNVGVARSNVLSATSQPVGSGRSASQTPNQLQQHQTQKDQQPVSVDSLDTDFLPLIHDVVRCIEKEVHEGHHPAAKPPGVGGSSLLRDNTSSSDYHNKIFQLKEKMDKFRQQVSLVKGIDASRQDQVKRVDSLQRQLVDKRQLLFKYKNQCPIDGIPKV